MGRFAWISETPDHPSVPTFVLALVGAPLTARDFEQVWQRRNMSQRHIRFQQRIAASPQHQGRSRSRSYYDFAPTHQPVSYHVTETIFPTLYRTDVKDQLLSILTQPYPVQDRLWNVQISSGGVVGQSGVIPKRLATSIMTTADHDPSATTDNSHHSTTSLSSPPPPTESLIVFSAHHALADGVSLSAAFTDLCDEGPMLQDAILQEWNKRKLQKKRRKPLSLWQKLQSLVHFVWACLQALGYQFQLWLVSPRHSPLQDHLLLVSPEGSRISRTLSWSQVATVDEIKRVAQSFGDKVTVNDLLVSCVSAAIARLIQHHRQHESILQQAKTEFGNRATTTTMTTTSHATDNTTTTQPSKNNNKNKKKNDQRVKSINVVIPVHLGGGVLLPGQSLGNKIGAMLARIPCEVSDENSQQQEQQDDNANSIHRLEQIHTILERVKQSPTAILSYALARTLASPPLSWMLPSSWITSIFTKSQLGATCVITNVRGPTQELHVEGRRVVTAQPFLPLPPGVPIGVALFSYAGVMNVSVNAQAWAVPNADQFLLWVVEEYQRLLELSNHHVKQVK